MEIYRENKIDRIIYQIKIYKNGKNYEFQTEKKRKYQRDKKWGFWRNL